jgi:tRNA(fMet)-specific endonuclease VapC
MTHEAVVDTDTLSAIMRRHPTALAKAAEYLALHQKLSFSSMTEYEIRRGLEYKRATRQLQKFNTLRASSEVLPISDAVIERAAAVYAELRRKGQLIGDGDIFIAATALEWNRRVVTNNLSHFSRIDGLLVESWLV